MACQHLINLYGRSRSVVVADKLITEIKLIARYSRHNEEQDFRFRDFVKLKLPMSNDDLDTVVRETTDEVWKQIDCLACGNCCKTLEVVVDQSDIARISRIKGMSISEFARRYVRSTADNALVLKSSPCVFLGEGNACTIYEHRPKACRDFPYLHEKGFRNRTLIMISKCSVCPIVFNVWQRLKGRFWPKKPAPGSR